MSNDACLVARLRAEIVWESAVGELLSRAADHIESLQQEVLEQRREIAGLREERRAILNADRPPGCTETGGL
jgi:vacuolar-type H+-ATPase subunit H